MSSIPSTLYRVESYEQAIDFLFGRINYERVHAEAYSTNDFKLDRMRHLLELMGNPQQKIPTIHVAGTKGKGSTCSMLASILRASGYRCGLYISPHITAFEERFSVDGVSPTQGELVDLVNRLMPIIVHLDNQPGRMQPTYFELATALAWQLFVDRNVDVAVLEVGLGGRLDSTNLCCPMVTVITNVSRDHTQVLGNTVSQIAYEKAGIIKKNVPVITAARHPEALQMIESTSRDRKAILRVYGQDYQLLNRTIDESGHVQIDVKTMTSNWQQIPVILRGPHQAENTAIVLAVVDELRQQNWSISDLDVKAGLLSVQWPARVELISQNPTVILDAAHNWESAKALVASLAEMPKACKRILVFGATRDKDITGILRQLLPNFETVVLTRYVENPRGIPLGELTRIVESITTNPFHTADNPMSAWKLATRLATEGDSIVITGSFFLVAELRDVILSEQPAR